MNNIFAKSLAAVLIGSAGLIGTSCADELDLKNPNEFDSKSYWENQDQAQMFIYALANQFRANYPVQIMFQAGEMRAGSLETNLINGSGAVDVDVIGNVIDVAHSQFSTFGNWYGYVANLNELIYKCENADEGVLADNVKNGLLGMGYGMRAYSYFQMYKMYGGVPLRLEPDVLFGEYTPEKLYKARATAEETLNQIKADISTALTHWNAAGNWTFNSKKDYYWSKAATEMLAGEVYLWSAKVETGDHTTANAAADIAAAKGYFSNVINNYGFSLYPDFRGIWTTPHNSESIFAMCYTSLSDNVTLGSPQYNMIWSKAAGAGTTAWSIQANNAFDWIEDGSASLFGYTYDPENERQVQYSVWNNLNPSPNRYMYKNALFYQYDYEDSRKECFMPMYGLTDVESALLGKNELVPYIANFDPTDYKMIGSFFLKYIPSIADGQITYAWWNDQPIYRLTLAYTYMAEIANYEGDGAGVENYINAVRKRAYGDKWDPTRFGYTAGSFVENESAIMREKDKEFACEGQRWWDLRRLTVTKGGSQTDHFMFQPQGCVGYGLNTTANPWMYEVGGSLVQTITPVLSTDEVHKLLWPIDNGLLGSDPLIEQNPGY